jgi:hypothetical protein
MDRVSMDTGLRPLMVTRTFFRCMFMAASVPAGEEREREREGEVR